jgi:PHD/YefM family antitoxin component YafN of YafNO toxin-antitoxin module
MNTIPAQDIKRRGISVVDKALETGPVYVVKSNRAEYVVLREQDYHEMLNDYADLCIALSEEEVLAGRVKRGSADTLLKAVFKED